MWSNTGKMRQRALHGRRSGKQMSLEDMMERGPIPAQTVANRVCKHLPEGYVLNLAMENGAAWVELIDADGNYVTLPDAGDRSIDEQINDALGVACGASDFNDEG